MDLSGPAKLYSELKQLQQTDPTKFKEVVTDIANKLKEAASSASSSDSTDSTDSTNSTTSTNPQAKMLSDIASKFEDVANGGDISELDPANQTQRSGLTLSMAKNGGHGGPGGAPPPPPSSSDSSSSDSSTSSSTSSAISAAYAKSTMSSMESLFSSIEEEVAGALSGS